MSIIRGRFSLSFFGLLALLLVAVIAFPCGRAHASSTGSLTPGEAAQQAIHRLSTTATTVTVKAGCSTADIQAALNKASDGTPVIVNIPAGTYKLTTSLFVYPNTTIKASSKAKLVKQGAYGAIIEAKLQKGKNGYNGTGYNGNHDITIDGGVWDSTPIMKSAEGTESFRFIHCKNITVKNATLCNVPNSSHLLVFAGVQNGVIENCKFYGVNNYSSSTSYPREAIQLDTCHSVVEVPTAQESEITWDDLACDKITISKCEIYHCQRAIGSHTAVQGHLHKNVTISGNKIHDVAETAIKLYNYQDSKVVNNTIKNTSGAILVYTVLKGSDDSYFSSKTGSIPKAHNIVVSGNKITKPRTVKTLDGDGIRVSGSASYPMKGVTLKNNTITSPARYGLFCSHAVNCTVGSGNKVTSPKADGILLNDGSNKSSITGNTVKSCGKSGIAVYDSSSVSVIGNTVSSTKSHGILGYSAPKLKVGTKAKTGNVVSGAKGNGIYLSVNNNKKGCAGSSVLYNTVKSATGDGVGLYLSKSCTVKGNKLTAGGCGVSLSTNCTGCKVNSNTVDSAGNSGISLTSGSKACTIRNNKVKKYSLKKADGAGVYVWKSGGLSAKKRTVVDGNTVTGSGSGTAKNGMKVSESPYTSVLANVVNNAKGHGVYVYLSSNAIVSANKVSNAKVKGISVSTSPKSQVTKNVISKMAKADAVSIYASNGTKESGNLVSA